MVALRVTECVSVRATVPGEGAAVAGLWRELGDTLKGMGRILGLAGPQRLRGARPIAR